MWQRALFTLLLSVRSVSFADIRDRPKEDTRNAPALRQLTPPPASECEFGQTMFW